MALRIVIDVFLAIGAIFALAGTIGLLKMPDTFSRMQASTCSAATAIKIAVIALLIITINPIGAHAIAKGAYRAGIRPEKRMETDDYGRDLEDE